MDERSGASSRHSAILWWIIGIGLIAAIAAFVVWLVRSTEPIIPPALIDRRAAAAHILSTSGQLPDVDIRPLVELEAAKDYAGASRLMAEALAANKARADASMELVGISRELEGLAGEVEPGALRAKAKAAFTTLKQLAEAQVRFYETRKALYEETRGYYEDLAASRPRDIPESIASLVETANGELERATALSVQFQQELKEFDDASQF